MIAIGIYLYTSSRAQRREDTQKWSLVKLLKDFTFTWILLGLLIFYIVSIKMSAFTIFAIGNIVVEVILILYGIKSRGRAPSQKETTRQ
jgi:energy-converting hydrogenase Eha subunit G